MKQIRHNAFETNSSSSHSITIVPGVFTPAPLPVDENGVCEIFAGEFGWEIETYTDAAVKASYALTWLMSQELSHHESLDRQQMLMDVIQEHTGATEVKFTQALGWDNQPNWGYIDHQSWNCGAEIWSSKENLASFIFNPNSVLMTDNDNH